MLFLLPPVFLSSAKKKSKREGRNMKCSRRSSAVSSIQVARLGKGGVAFFSHSPLMGTSLSSSSPSTPLQFLPIHRRTFSSSAVLRADIFSQAFEQVEEKLQGEKKEKEETKVEKKEVSKEIFHIGKNLRVSVKRLAPLLTQIRGLSYREAVVQLSFCSMRCAPWIKTAVEKCRQKAEWNQLNPDRLLLSTFEFCGRLITNIPSLLCLTKKKATIHACKGNSRPKRPEFKGRGKLGWRRKQTSHVYVGLKEIPYVEGEKVLGKFGRGVNKFRRMDWNKKVQEAASALNEHPLFINTRTVKRYHHEQEKARAKAAKEAAAAANASTSTSTETSAVSAP